jgi:membrane fusion protein (multidrug efflux system)
MTVRRASLLVLGLTVLNACDRGEPGRIPTDLTPADVEVSAPAAGASTLAVPGTVRSTREAEVATRVSGTVRDVRVDVGATVAAGAALAVLDDADVRAAVRRAEAEAERARAYHARIAALARDGAATRQELDDAVAGSEAAEAALEAARAQLDYVVIRAPFTGAVTARYVDPGDLAVPGMPVVALVRPGTVEVEADLPADRAATLAVGTALTVETADGRVLPVTVGSVSPALDRQSRRARVKLSFEDGEAGLPVPGSFVRVRLEIGGPAGVWVPRDAVVERGQLTGLYVVEDDHVRLRWIRTGEVRAPATGATGEAAIEILAGLGAQELVVRRPPATLHDGSPLGDVRQIDWTLADGPR